MGLDSVERKAAEKKVFSYAVFNSQLSFVFINQIN